MKKKKRKEKQGIAEVAVVKCSNYEQAKVDKAVSKALKIIDFEICRGAKVLLKPNVLGAFNKKRQLAITTNPAVLIAVCKILKKKGCKIFIGDSSFMGTGIAMKAAGIEAVAKKYGKLVIFEKQKLVTIKDSKAKILKSFPIAKIVKDVDLVIDMPKMKTHSLARVTLALKNLYGLIPGGLKQRLHRKAKGSRFSHIIIDIYQNVIPKLNIMDAVLGMDGHGPASGQPKKAGLILASKNSVAMDIAASSIMEFKPRKVPAIKYAVKRKLYPNYKFKLVGMAKLPKIHFRKPVKDKPLSKVRRMIKILGEKPIVCDTKKCIKCGACAKYCPVKAITLCPYPIIDKKKCIRCFCCMEVCPVHALSLGKRGANVWQNYEGDIPKIKKK